MYMLIIILYAYIWVKFCILLSDVFYKNRPSVTRVSRQQGSGVTYLSLGENKDNVLISHHKVGDGVNGNAC